MMVEIIKEMRYAFRSGRVLILLASFLFFALLTPVMLKVVLPQILFGRSTGETAQVIGGFTNMTQIGCVRNYMEDVFQIGTLIVVFTLCGMTASEIREQTWVLPLCAGKRFGRMIGAKLLAFGTVLVLTPILALLADYSYSGLLFGFEIGVFPILYGGLLQGVYMLFLLACLIMWGVLMKKPIPRRFFDTGDGVWHTFYRIPAQRCCVDAFRPAGRSGETHADGHALAVHPVGCYAAACYRHDRAHLVSV